MEITHRQEYILSILKEENSASLNFIENASKLTKEEILEDLKALSGLKLVREEDDRYYFHGAKYYSFFEQIIKNYPVSNVMSMPVVMEDTSSIYDAVVNIFLNNIGTLYVSKNGYLSGVISRKDIIRSTVGEIDPYITPINLIMTRMPNIIYAKEEDSIYSCVKKLVDYQIDSIPVVEEVEDKKYKIIGRFTKTNVANIFVGLGENKNIEGMI